jgi:glycosyltransferase involved in cell wall biosynthesis
MISVLIPVYNYNVVALVKSIHKQLAATSINFEIKCLDDCSTVYISENSTVSNLHNTTFETSTTNKGRNATRQQLAETALYDWLLFLDADVLPKSEQFIQNYLAYATSNFDAIYGGFAYYEELPKSNYTLRWKYGKIKEQVSAVIRNKTPYKVIISANFMVKKEVFLKINSKINAKGYGYDNYFGAMLKSNHINVLHIDNEVYHLGIDDSSTYLRKKELAAETLVTLSNSGFISQHDNDLLKLFEQLKYFKLHYVLNLMHHCFASRMKKNLISKKPSIPLLQLYRITYMCYFELKNR